jgi:hypothetical protein
MKQAHEAEPPAGRPQDPEDLGEALVDDEADDQEEAERRGETEVEAKRL